MRNLATSMMRVLVAATPVCSKCGVPGHNRRSCGRAPKGQPYTPRHKVPAQDRPSVAVAGERLFLARDDGRSSGRRNEAVPRSVFLQANKDARPRLAVLAEPMPARCGGGGGDSDRPRTRAECADAPRPCPWVGCRHHLYLEVNPSSGTIQVHRPDIEPWEMAESCSLDVAERGGVTLEQTGEIMNVTRERVRQMEVAGLMRLKRVAAVSELDPNWEREVNTRGVQARSKR